MLEVGDKFILTEDAIDNYGEQYRGKEFEVIGVATSSEEHIGYDEVMSGMALYDALGLEFSVYDYEVEKV